MNRYNVFIERPGEWVARSISVSIIHDYTSKDRYGDGKDVCGSKYGILQLRRTRVLLRYITKRA